MSNLSRSRTRKFLYQMLYAASFSKLNKENFNDSFFSWIFESQLDEEYLNEMFDLVIKNQSFFACLIKKYAPKFDIENMDLAYILPVFIWVWEILFFSWEIPLKVSLNEAVEISKVYGDDSSKKIVNWILNSVVKDLETIKNDLQNWNFEKNYVLFREYK